MSGLYIVLLVHIVIIMFNYCTALAWLQRRDVTKHKKRFVSHSVIAIVLALPGLFTLIPILFAARFPKYGLKWKLREKQGGYWHLLYMTNFSYAHTDYHSFSDCEGRYIDIWR
jgi:hypothetical protein